MKTKHEESPIIACLDGSSNLPGSTTRDKLIFFEICPYHKNDYGTIGEPTPKEVKLERALELKNKEIQKLKAQRDTTDEYASNMQQRSNKAVHDRDESNYALKQALVEVEKYKSRLKTAESLIGSGRPEKNNKKSLITPISVGMTTILAIVIFGRRFS